MEDPREDGDAVAAAAPPVPKNTNYMMMARLMQMCKLPPSSTDPTFTHTSMGRPGGKYYFSVVNIERFMNAYCRCLDSGTIDPKMALIERHRHIGPVVLDIDLRQTVPERLYTSDDVDIFVAALFSELALLVDLDKIADRRCFVLEKPAPRPNKSSGTFKDGLHLYIPGVVTRPELQLALRAAMLKCVALGFDSRYTNSAEDIYDAAVISRNGMFLYGCMKPDEDAPWKLTRVLEVDRGGNVNTIWSAATSEVDYASPGSITKLISLRRFDVDEAPLTARGDAAVQLIIDREEEAVEARERARAAAEGKDAGGVEDIDEAKLATLVGMLSPGRATSYNDWVLVGFALRNITAASDKGRELWKKFAARCPEGKYDAEANDAKWARMGLARPDGVGIDKLRKWAKHDSPAAFAAWDASVEVARRERQSRSADGSTSSAKQSSYERLMLKLEDHAQARALRKLGNTGKVLRPVQGCPCAYEKYMDGLEYIDEVLRGDPDYRANVRRVAELKTYMEVYNEDAFPRIKWDLDMLSFSNGVLFLSESRFVPYPAEGEPLAAELVGKVARHHINLPFTGCEDTPLMDSLLSRQFGPIGEGGDGRGETLYAMIGRLFFRVRQFENWQVMILLLGEGGTGKSTVMAVITALFAADAVGEIDGNNERTFGLMDKFDKQVLFIRDAPKNMNEVLAQELFQKMISGEGIQVSVKHKSAFVVPWTAPIIGASNVMFDYSDDAGQTSRRVAVLDFNKPIDMMDGDTTLEARIINTELANLVAKCLRLYRELVDRSNGGIFWRVCPPVLRETQEETMSEGNLVYKFLRAGPNESSSRTKRTYVVRVEGEVTDWLDFKNAFEAYVRYKHPNKKWTLKVSQNGPFTKLGYEVLHDNICRACGKHAYSGCCESYHMANRTKVWRIRNMRLVHEYITIPFVAENDDLEPSSSGM
jgi:hypothetical protein